MYALERAVILAAGLGSRLRPLTERVPKTLVEVCGTPILFNAIKNINRLGVPRITVVVGYLEDVVRSACRHEFPEIALDFVTSSEYRSTGSAYSLWLALHERSARTLVLEGDIFFEAAVVERTAAAVGDGGAVAVAPFRPPLTGTTVNVRPVDSRICSFERNQTLYDGRGPLERFKTVNVYAFGESYISSVLTPALTAAYTSGQTHLYLEDVLQMTLNDDLEPSLKAVDVGDLKWYEIDDAKDLRHAESIFARGERRNA